MASLTVLTITPPRTFDESILTLTRISVVDVIRVAKSAMTWWKEMKPQWMCVVDARRRANIGEFANSRTGSRLCPKGFDLRLLIASFANELQQRLDFQDLHQLTLLEGRTDGT